VPYSLTPPTHLGGGNGGDKDDDKNDKKARLPKTKKKTEAVGDDDVRGWGGDGYKSTRQNKTKWHGTTEEDTTEGVMNNVGRWFGEGRGVRVGP